MVERGDSTGVRAAETEPTQGDRTVSGVFEDDGCEAARHRWVMRVWLPDRPGSLAAVAGAISDKGADVVAIDVVDRGAETAIDDITVDLGGCNITDVVTAVTSLPDVAVEDVREERGWRLTRAESLHHAARLLAPGCDRPLGELCDLVVAGLGADWAAVTQREGYLLAGSGELPDPVWLRSFATGLGFGGGRGVAVDGTVFERVGDGGLIVGRGLPELSAAEVEEIGGWAAIATLLLPSLVQ